MDAPVYFFTGMGSEYVLAPLAAHFRDEGHKVAELDFVFNKKARQVLESLSGQRIVMVSSAHPDFDQYALKHLNHIDNDFLSTLELFQYLKPEAAFYVPHDLTSSIEDNEICWLPFFTASLNPLPHLWWLEKFSPAFEVGWIRKNMARKSGYVLESYGNRHKFIYFPTFAEAHKKLGADGIYKLYQPMFERQVPIKLFNWEGVEELENGLRAKGAKVVPAAVNTFDLMRQADAVICIGASSTAIEAYLQGLPLVCLQDVMINRKVRRNYLSGLYDIKFMTVSAVGQWVKDLNDGTCHLPLQKEDRLPAFDFDKALDIIVNFRR